MKSPLTWLCLLLAASSFAFACGDSQAGGDTQTNWLKGCSQSDECGTLECVCGHCVKSCTVTADCNGTPVTTSCQPEVSSGAQALCASSAPVSVCLGSCTGRTDCAEGEDCVGGACVPGSETMPDSSAQAVLDFCQRWMERQCKYVEDCGCGSAAGQKCREQLASACDASGFVGSLAGSVSSGDLVFDPAAADDFLARYDAPDPLCAREMFRDLELDSLEVHSYAGAFLGTHELGSACTLPVGYKGGVSDCREGLCAGSDSGAGKCIELAALGEGCSASGDENLVSSTTRLCFDLRPADSDGEYESAFDSLSCVSGVCARNLDSGAPCDDDEACQSGRCASVGVQMGECTPKLPDGEVCSSGGDCQSGACDYGATPSLCGPPLADGSDCSYDDAACASGSCNQTNQSGGTCGAPPMGAIGEPCAGDYECITKTCRLEKCWADICGDYL
ncbi:MAG TPA: hypothetical protein VGP93_14880 [Polyangiaceae bacterium]|nr:hypothetical protein [Polyangiaceae bacterium]